MEQKNLKVLKDSITLKEDIEIVRYKGSKIIREMIERNEYIEAFTHTQLGIEKILWDKIVGIFEGKKAMEVRKTIEESKKGRDKQNTKTYELIKWAHFLRAINDDEFKDLGCFNRKRNKIMHSHGEWWDKKEYKEAFQKGIRFLENNNF